MVLPSNKAAAEQAFPSTATLSHTAKKAVWSSPIAVLDLPLSCTLGGIIKQFLESLACLWWYVPSVQCNHANSPAKITFVPARSGLEGLQYILCDKVQNNQILCGTIQLADRYRTSIPLKHILLWNNYKATYENFRQCCVSFGSATLGSTYCVCTHLYPQNFVPGSNKQHQSAAEPVSL